MGQLRAIWVLSVFVAVNGAAAEPNVATTRTFNATATKAVIDSGSVKAPCYQGNAPGPYEAGLRACTEVLPESVQVLEDRVHLQTSNLYKGCDYDSTKTPMTEGSCSGRPYKTPTCNLTPSALNNTPNQPEVTGCGNWTFMKTGGGCNWRGKCHFWVTPVRDENHGTREDAHARGAWIQALACFTEQVKQEIMRGELHLTAIPGSDNSSVQPSAAMALDQVQKQQGINALGTKLGRSVSSIVDHKNNPDLENCTAATAQMDAHRQSACDLKAGRAGTEAMFQYLAAYEVFIRAQYAYSNLMYDFFNPTSLATLRDTIKNRCGGREANDCYADEYPKIFRDKVDSWFYTNLTAGQCRLN